MKKSKSLEMELVPGSSPGQAIPAKAGIQLVHLIVFKGSQSYELDSRLRGNDGALGALTIFHRL